MKNLFFILFLFSNLQVVAQVPEVVWNQFFGNTNGGSGQSFIRKSDGGHIVLGIVHANGGDVSGYHGGSSDIWVASINKAGVVVWQRCLGGSDADMVSGNGTGGGCLQATADGGYILTGISKSSDGDVKTNHGGWDAWVVKLSGTGSIEWERAYGGANDEFDSKISQTADGGYLLAVTSNSSNSGDVGTSHGLTDAWVVKLDNTGGVQWQKCLGSSNYELMGNFIQTADEGFLFAMSSRGNDGNVSGNHKTGYYDYWITKLDKTGAVTWQKCYGGNDEDYALDVCKTVGGYAVSGYSYSMDGDVSMNNGDTDCWFIGIDESGNLLWEHAYGGIAADMAYGIEPTPDGGFIAACSAETFGGDHGDISNSYGDFDGWLLKLSPTGALQWQKCIGGTVNDWCFQVIPLPKDNYEILGQTNSNDGTVTGNPWPRSLWISLLNTGTALPVHFLSFTGKLNGQDAVLDWKAEASGDGKEFLVERSIDAQHFTRIASLNYENGRSVYKYTDTRAFTASNTIYYRIIGVDRNDVRTVSNIVRLSGTKEQGGETSKLLGNPVHKDLMMEVYCEAPGIYQLSIYDMSGKISMSATVQAQKGQNLFRQSLGDLLPGVYIVQLSSVGKGAKTIFQARFVKK